jgi:hypothetical protein
MQSCEEDDPPEPVDANLNLEAGAPVLSLEEKVTPEGVCWLCNLLKYFDFDLLHSKGLYSMSWGAQSRSEDAKPPSVGRGRSEKPELGCRPVQP